MKVESWNRPQIAPPNLSTFNSQLSTHLNPIDTASARPYSRYPIVYKMEDPWGILLPHLARFKSASQRLQIKACAELAAGHSDKAVEDVTLILNLADSVKDE